MMKRGFTVIEIVVIIVIVAILSTVAVLSYNRFQDQTRDAKRESQVTVIAEGLEKYYDKNGEYPSCALLTADPLVVSETIEIDQAALKTPRGSVDNAFVCSELSSSDTTDSLGYVGDGSSECVSGDICTYWTIQYWRDETGTIQSITSRRTSTP